MSRLFRHSKKVAKTNLAVPDEEEEEEDSQIRVQVGQMDISDNNADKSEDDFKLYVLRDGPPLSFMGRQQNESSLLAEDQMIPPEQHASVMSNCGNDSVSVTFFGGHFPEDHLLTQNSCNKIYQTTFVFHEGLVSQISSTTKKDKAVAFRQSIQPHLSKKPPSSQTMTGSNIPSLTGSNIVRIGNDLWIVHGYSVVDHRNLDNVYKVKNYFKENSEAIPDVFLYCGVYYQSFLPDYEIENLKKKNLFLSGDLPEARMDHIVCGNPLNKKELILLGGQTLEFVGPKSVSRNPTEAAYILNTETLQWRTVKLSGEDNRILTRSRFGFCVSGNKFFLCGGLSVENDKFKWHNILDLVEVDPSQARWSVKVISLKGLLDVPLVATKLYGCSLSLRPLQQQQDSTILFLYGGTTQQSNPWTASQYKNSDRMFWINIEQETIRSVKVTEAAASAAVSNAGLRLSDVGSYWMNNNTLLLMGRPLYLVVDVYMIILHLTFKVAACLRRGVVVEERY